MKLDTPIRALLLACSIASACAPPVRRDERLAATAAGAGSTAVAPGARARGTLDFAALDRLIEASWRNAGVTPAPAASDGEWLRRVTLDLAGRVPTLTEAKAFLADRAPDKRARTVDRLLGSPDFAAHFSDVYADLLFGQERNAARLEKRYDPEGWLAQAFAENRGYDRLAHEILTAAGDLRSNPAGTFLVARARGGGGAEAVTGAVARIFLGLQIQCAQCHDHPYDARWKQEDFYGLVAYFSRTRARNEPIRNDLMERVMAAETENPTPGMTTGTSMAAAPMAMPPAKMPKDNNKTFVVFDARRGEAKMRKPRTEVDQVVAPRFLGRALPDRPGETRRQLVARAILGSDLFPKAMVARTWAQLFGASLVDAWDDLGGEGNPQHPALLVELSRDFAASGHDVKRLLRALVLSTAYARSSSSGRPGDDGDPAAVRAFARAGVRPLSPQPLFRSLVVATGAADVVRRRLDEDGTARRMSQAFREYQFVFGDDEMAEANRFDGSVPRSLLLLNGELTNNGSRAAPGSVLSNILAASRSPATRVDDMFLAVYTRTPTADEREPLVAHLFAANNARAAYEDLFFALLTSTEAITNH